MNDLTVIPDLPFFTESGGPRRPRIALMGEFSAGKSTLANLMLGSDPLPVHVTATQLPPIWIRYGEGPAVVVNLEGAEETCATDDLQAVVEQNTAYVRIHVRDDILRVCDIIDMPGISDPNMLSEVWERVMPLADGVVWCTSATQAWRQSEAAVWEKVPEHVKAHSILLMTRADMLLSDRDKRRVLKRISSETDGQFAACLPISLVHARDCEDDPDLWAASGAEPFIATFLGVISALKDALGADAVAGKMPRLHRSASDVESQTQETDAPRTAVTPRRPVPVSGQPRRGRLTQMGEGSR